MFYSIEMPTKILELRFYCFFISNGTTTRKAFGERPYFNSGAIRGVNNVPIRGLKSGEVSNRIRTCRKQNINSYTQSTSKRVGRRAVISRPKSG